MSVDNWPPPVLNCGNSDYFRIKSAVPEGFLCWVMHFTAKTQPWPPRSFQKTGIKLWKGADQGMGIKKYLNSILHYFTQFFTILPITHYFTQLLTILLNSSLFYQLLTILLNYSLFYSILHYFTNYSQFYSITHYFTQVLTILLNSSLFYSILHYFTQFFTILLNDSLFY